MSHEVESMFSARGEVPWHGLGTIVNEAPTSAKALELAGLDWEVEKKRILVQVDDGNNPIPDYFANVRSTDNKVLGIVKDRYSIVQNKEAFSFVDNLVDIGQGTIAYETAGALFEGKKTWMLTKLPDFEVMGDLINNYLCFVNSFDGTGAIRAIVTPVRVVCNNTLNLAFSKAIKSWSCMHTGNLQKKLEEAKTSLDLNFKYVEVFREEASSLQEIKINFTEFLKMLYADLPLDSGLQLKRKELIRGEVLLLTQASDLVRFGNSAWTMLNAISDFENHRVSVRRSNTFEERRWNTIISGETILDRAYELIKKRY